jgi:hypothetical protein
MRPLAYRRIGWGVVFLFAVVPAIFPRRRGCKLVETAEQSPRHNVERLRGRFVISTAICVSFSLGRNFRTRHECCARAIEAAAPKDEVEDALDVQMACTHTAAMAVLAKLDVPYGAASCVRIDAARLMRA